METGMDEAAATRLDREAREAVRAKGEPEAGVADGLDFVEVKDLEDSAEIMSRVLKLMSTTCLIDIGDFDIPNRGGPVGKVEVFVKRFVWKLLRFYTYRMFSQQREFNAQIVAVLNEMWVRLRKLEGGRESVGH